MDHLERAKRFARSADGADISYDWAQVYAQLATAYALIAWVERVDKVADDAEIAAERENLIHERMAQRQAVGALECASQAR